MTIHMMMTTTTSGAHAQSTDSIAVVTDPFEIVSALCEADEWDLALRLARDHDRRARDQ